MEVKIKTLGGDQLQVNVDLAATIADLKALIEEAKPSIGVASQMTLIFAGRILEDGILLEELSLKSTDFLVAMASKTKRKTPASPASKAEAVEAPRPLPSAASPSDVIPVEAAEEKAKPPNDGGAEAAELKAEPPNDGGDRAADDEDSIAALCVMGFPRPEVIRCLRAASNDADRAVEYLIMGLPSGATEDAGEASPSVGIPQQSVPFPVLPASRVAPEVASGQSADVTAAFAELRAHPQFQEYVDMIRAQPETLKHVLQALRQENPQLFAVVNGNRAAFIEFLKAGGGLGPREGSGFRFSREELRAIGRLEQLGFSRAAVVEAYLACDKQEELTANYLFEHGEAYDDD